MHPDKNVAMTDHQYGTCVHKLFSTFKDGLDTKFEDHQDSIINFQNDETNMNAEFMSNFITSYENRISGTVQIIPFNFDASIAASSSLYNHFTCNILYVTYYILRIFDRLKISLRNQ